MTEIVGSLALLLVGAASALVYCGMRHQAMKAEFARKLRRSETKFDQIAAIASDWFWEQGSDLRYRYISRSETRRGDLDVSKFIGLTRRETVGDEMAEEEWLRHEADLAARRPFDDFRMKRRDKDGRVRTYTVSGMPIHDEAGSFAGYRGIGRDITDRVEAEEKVLREREFLQSILDALPARISVKGGDGRYILASRAFVEFLGVPRDEILGHTPVEIAARTDEHPLSIESAEAILAEDRQIAETGDSIFRAERRRPLKDGAVRWEEVTKIPFLAHGQEKPWIMASVSDITELKRAERRLRTLSRAIEQSPVAVMVSDPEGRIEYVNQAFQRVSGYGAEEVVGCNPRILKSGYTSSEEYRRLWRKLLAGETWTGELLNRAKDGHLFWEEAAISPVIDESGSIHNFIAIKTEITERKRLEQELVAACERAEAANRAKSNFLAMVSHELRTPLNAVIGFSDIIHRGILGSVTPAVYAEYAQDINTSGQMLLSLVNDILDLTRVESGRDALSMAMVDVSTVIQDVTKLLRALADNGGHRIDIDCVPGIEAKIDRRAVKQIVINLTGNAAKYTDRGGLISISSRRNRDGRVALAVSDTGIGMTEEEVAVAMEPFTRLSNRLTTASQGLGVGLHIVRRLVDAMGAEMTIESSPGAGTTVLVVFAGSQDDDDERNPRSEPASFPAGTR